MRISELSLVKHNMRSPQINERAKLIEFARTLCSERMLARTTLHLACFVIDRFMDVFMVAQERLKLFVTVCVLLAAKLEDRGDNIPRWAELKPYLESGLNDPKELATFELMILNALRWKVNIPTAASFLEYYIVASIRMDDVPIRLRSWTDSKCDSAERHSQVFPALRLRMYNLVYYLLDLSLSDHRMIGVRPSKLASACILCARQMQGLRPFWTAELTSMCQYEMQDVCGVAKDLRRQFVAAQELTSMHLMER